MPKKKKNLTIEDIRRQTRERVRRYRERQKKIEEKIRKKIDRDFHNKVSAKKKKK